MNLFRKEDLLIDILSYGEDCLKKSTDFTKNQIVDELKKHHELDYLNNAIDTFLEENFIPFRNDTYRLNSEGYSRLLNHRNLKAAKTGIWTAVILGLISIVFSIISLLAVNAVEFTKEQNTKLKEEIQPIYKSLNQLIKCDSLRSLNDSLNCKIDNTNKLKGKDSNSVKSEQ